MAFAPTQLLIVGAGFSFNAGLPLASEFTSHLLDTTGLNLDGPSQGQVRFLKDFVDQVFGEGETRTAEDWRELEDIFTMVDLAANSGHHLGKSFSASQLRVVRRALIVRMIRMLSQSYNRRQRDVDTNWKRLEKVFEGFDLGTTAVLSMNWDTVFESGIRRAQSVRTVDYGFELKQRKFSSGKLVPVLSKTDPYPLRILKPHGSVNWLYCDACRESVAVPPQDTERVAQSLFGIRDWNAIADHLGSTRKRPSVLSPPCPHCKSESLGTRFATFSYRKALDFPMHSSSWKTAESYLKQSVDWVFFGYSMPAADFEFKQLLKRVQLTESVRPRITVITGGADSKATVSRFQKFFGNAPSDRFFFENGLDPAALRHLTTVGVMKAK